MSTPVRHHYLPKWYLKRWMISSADPRVWTYKRHRSELWVERSHPKGTGFQNDLYSVQSRKDPEARQEMETKFMSPIDFYAHLALQHMQDTGERPTHPRLRSAWARFLMSLLYRSPDRIAWLRSKVEEHDGMEELKQTFYNERKADQPETFEEWYAAQSAGLLDEAQAVLVRNLIDSKRIGEQIMRMDWSIITLHDPVNGLLTSDDPLMMSNGLGHRDGFMVVPISPNKLFLATVDKPVRDAFANQDGKAFERAMNDAVVRQAKELVVGQTDKQRRFVDNRLKRDTTPEPGLLNRKTWKTPLIRQ